MEWFSTADLIEWSGATLRQRTYWCEAGYIGGRYLDRGTGLVTDASGSGYNRVFDALDLSVAKVLVEVAAVLGMGCTRYVEIVKALRALPLEQWPGRTLVVSARGVGIDMGFGGPFGAAALVVDLGACAYPEGNGLAAVI